MSDLTKRLRNERPYDMLSVLALHIQAADALEAQEARIVDLSRAILSLRGDSWEGSHMGEVCVSVALLDECAALAALTPPLK